MGIFDRINPFKTAKKELNIADRVRGRVGGSFLIMGKPDPIYKVFDNCGIDYEGRNPRSHVALSRTMYGVFPFAKRAINDMATMVGNPLIVSAEGREIGEAELNRVSALMGELPLLSEWDWLREHEMGLDNLAFRTSKTMLLDGMCFLEDRFDEGSLLDPLGVLLFDSMSFDYIQDNYGQPYRLRYLADQYPDLDSGTFHVLGYDYRNDYPWAAPLLSGGGFFTHILTAMLVAVKNISMRKGAPVEMNIISVQDDSKLSSPDTRERYVESMNALDKDLQEAMKAQMKGHPSSMVSKIPMDVDLLNRAFGSEALNEIDPELLKFMLVGFANLLEIPIEFLGIVLGSSGFSPERFNILYRIWGTKIDNIRNKLRPVLLKSTQSYLRGQGVSPVIIEGIDIEFENAEIRQDSELAEIEKTKAETHKIRMETAEALSQVDTQHAREYIEQFVTTE